MTNRASDLRIPRFDALQLKPFSEGGSDLVGRKNWARGCVMKCESLNSGI